MPSKEHLLNEAKVIELLNLTRSKMDLDALRGVEHYLEHRELVLALELLCLQVIGENIDLPPDKEAQLLNLAQRLIDPSSAYDANVLEKLNAYVSKN